METVGFEISVIDLMKRKLVLIECNIIKNHVFSVFKEDFTNSIILAIL